MLDNNVYRLAPMTQVVRTGKQVLQIKTEQVSIELNGSSAQLFELEIVPLLDGVRNVAEIAKVIGFADSSSLEELFTELNHAGVLLQTGSSIDKSDPFLDYMEMLGVNRKETETRLADLRIAVIGQRKLGHLIGRHLSSLPIKQLSLIGEKPNQKPFNEINSLTKIDYLHSSYSETEIDDIVTSHDFVISTLGTAYAAVDHRVNRAIHSHGTPALFCRLGLDKCIVGPTVFPFETACFTCWQMRVSACANNFTDHIKFEESIAAQENPVYTPITELGYLSMMVAGAAINELLKSTLALGHSHSVDHILEFEPFKAGWSEHSLLRRADCPVCSKKKYQIPPQPSLNELINTPDGDLLSYIPHLVSNSIGIVRKLDRVHKDLSEPKLPFIYRAEIANHRFLEKETDAFIIASGKGFTRELAMLSAMGEAVERYASSNWGEERILRGRASDLDIECLDPHRLILFKPEQYKNLKYDPYSEEASLGWVAMRSFGSGAELAVPALAVLMAYETIGDEPFLFPITSNGLAAGPTLPKAILNAAYECIERDAFLYTWLNQLPCNRINPKDLPDKDILAMITSYERRGVTLELYNVPTDNGVFVFIGIAVSDSDIDGPAAVVGLGADHNPVAAAKSALVEACQVRPSLRMRLRLPETKKRITELVENPNLVTELEDHDLLYASSEMLPHFDFLRQQPEVNFNWGNLQEHNPVQLLHELTSQLNKEGTDLLFANLSTDDVLAAGAHVVRVIIPDYQPMHFGIAERRLAAKRLYTVCNKFFDYETLSGFRKQESGLNPLPHPLA